ncbi:MAG: 4-hydroxy-3-methylbut-2-en-1-yl diphosphate synthase (ferredoxin) [Chlamydiae bacterium]|nr:4-hydroxy-3-methylbut-2-en-1-yl diphosphate synthase (ferredoxin) [Chlamydiota bacterium]
MKKYCSFTFKTSRFPTRVVPVGDVLVGGGNSIRIQSMTTTDTKDVKGTVEQIMRLADVGCEIARVTVQGMKEAQSCEKIKSELIQKGYTIPLVADIHFFPKAAMTVVDFVDKVRINPGNYVDPRASFKTRTYSESDYQKELLRLEEKFSPLVEKCKKLKVAMRIGTNHGSLSDRIMNQFGDSPQGMVESALEYTRICRKLDYHQLIFSMKASNTHVMIQAYRLLVSRMIELGLDYPLHLGVTEAGNGEEGRIKSAVGIGSLLLDGLGDTIRVSLTEDPWQEIEPCRQLINLSNKYLQMQPSLPFVEKNRNPYEYQKRNSQISNKPLLKEGSIYLRVLEDDLLKDSFVSEIGLNSEGESLSKDLKTVDGLFINGSIAHPNALEKIEVLKNMGIGIFYDKDEKKGDTSYFSVNEKDAFPTIEALNQSDLILLKLNTDKIHYARTFFDYLKENKCLIPVLYEVKYSGCKDETSISIGAELGSLLCDGLGDGVLVNSQLGVTENRQLGLNLLQACRLRSSKTEFISCPSCGRTLFDLQTVTQKIQERTAHLPGVKIAIMGCVVNGPGEMADADFGYVGSRPGMIDLYVGKECVDKHIEHSQAVDRLVALLKTQGVWKEPETSLVSLS